MMREQFSKIFKTDKRGVSVVEIIISLALLAVIFVAVFKVQWGIADLQTNNVRTLTALNFSETQLLDLVHKNLLNGWNFDFSGNVSIFSSLIPQGFEEVFSQFPITRCLFQTSLETRWRTGWNSTSTRAISIADTDLDLAQKYGLDCGGVPGRFDSNRFELVDTVDFGLPVTSIDIFDGHVYVGLKSADASDADIAVFPIANPSNVSFLDIGSGLNKIDAISGQIFGAANAQAGQFAAFGLESTGNFGQTSTSTLPGVAGVRPEGISISYFDSKVFVGTKRTAGREFHIFGVDEAGSGSGGAEPEWLGMREVNHNINDISVVGDLAFLATSGNVRDLIVLDVSDPHNIVSAAEVDIDGTEDGRSVFVAGNLIFLGRHKGTAPSRKELYVLEYSLDADGNFLDAQSLAAASTGADVNALTFALGHVFAATSHSQKELQIFRFDNFDNKGGLNLVYSVNLPDPATGIDFEDKVLAVSAGNKVYVYEQR